MNEIVKISTCQSIATFVFKLILYAERSDLSIDVDIMGAIRFPVIMQVVLR